MAKLGKVRCDEVYRLIGTERGYLTEQNGQKVIANSTLEQQWGLDGLGNWATFNEDQGGNGWDLQQTRAANDANEIDTDNLHGNTPGDSISSTGGTPNWADPVYDAAGNMTKLPKPASPTSSFTCTYDAWNRLVEVKDGANVVATYSYDGLNRRITRTAGGTTRHYYVTVSNQVLEERVDSATTADRQYVWGLRYADDLILRDRDAAEGGDLGGDGNPNNGTTGLDERLYVFQDANWNVTALVSTAGVVLERYAYDPYGKSLKLNPDFTDKTSGTDYQWTYRYTTQEFDPDTGVIYYGARYYDPNSGTWISRDQAQSDPNLYRYVGSNPLNRTDPTGMEESGGKVSDPDPRMIVVPKKGNLYPRPCSRWGPLQRGVRTCRPTTIAPVTQRQGPTIHAAPTIGSPEWYIEQEWIEKQRRLEELLPPSKHNPHGPEEPQPGPVNRPNYGPPPSRIPPVTRTPSGGSGFY